MDKDDILRHAVAGVRRAAGYCPNVEFSPEDASRTEADFLCRVVEAAIDAGATTVNIPDTVGYATPSPHGAGHPQPPQPRAQHRQGGAQRTLPQRPGPGRGQQPGRRRGRRRPGRVHHQRPGRAGRQLLAGGDRHGAADPQRFLPRRDPHRHPAAGAHQPPGGQRHRHPRAAQQGHRRAERLRPRGGHPPGRHAQGAHHLRDHAARRRGLRHHRAGAGQAQRPGGPGQPRQGNGLRLGPRANPDRLRGLQAPGRQEEGNLRRRHRRVDRAPDAGRAGALVAGLLRGGQRHGQDPPAPRCGSAAAAKS